MSSWKDLVTVWMDVTLEKEAPYIVQSLTFTNPLFSLIKDSYGMTGGEKKNDLLHTTHNTPFTNKNTAPQPSPPLSNTEHPLFTIGHFR